MPVLCCRAGHVVNVSQAEGNEAVLSTNHPELEFKRACGAGQRDRSCKHEYVHSEVKDVLNRETVVLQPTPCRVHPLAIGGSREDGFMSVNIGH